MHLEYQLLHAVNDGLKTLFFLVLGLEIKRELLAGELRDPQLAFTALAAAMGGVVAPAAVYFIVNAGEPMPMAGAYPWRQILHLSWVCCCFWATGQLRA